MQERIPQEGMGQRSAGPSQVGSPPRPRPLVVKSPEQNSEKAASATSSMRECPPVELGGQKEGGYLGSPLRDPTLQGTGRHIHSILALVGKADGLQRRKHDQTTTVPEYLGR